MATYGPVERAVRAELRSRGVSLAESTLGATMVSLARQMDTSRGAVAGAAAAAQLRETRARLIEELDRRPVAEDPVDEIAEKRRRRRVGGA